MKTFLTIITCLTISHGYCQEHKITGKYWSDSIHYVAIGADDTAEFFVQYGCCLMTEVYGKGTYTLEDSILEISTSFPGTKRISNHQIIDELNQDNKVEFRVKNANGLVEFGSILLIDSATQKLIKGISTDEHGIAQLIDLEPEKIKGSIIRFESLGMDTYSIPLNDIVGHAVEVELKPYRIIQNEVIEFRVLSENGKTYLSGPVFIQHEASGMSTGDKFKMIFSQWPWNWSFRYSHEANDQIFERK